MRCRVRRASGAGPCRGPGSRAAGESPADGDGCRRSGWAPAPGPGQDAPSPLWCPGTQKRIRYGRLPFQADLIKGKGHLSLAYGDVGLRLAGAAQGLQLAAPLLGAGLGEPVLSLEVTAQLDATAVMQQPLRAADRQLVLSGVAAAASLGLQEQRRPPLPQDGSLSTPGAALPPCPLRALLVGAGAHQRRADPWGTASDQVLQRDHPRGSDQALGREAEGGLAGPPAPVDAASRGQATGQKLLMVSRSGSLSASTAAIPAGRANPAARGLGCRLPRPSPGVIEAGSACRAPLAAATRFGFSCLHWPEPAFRRSVARS